MNCLNEINLNINNKIPQSKQEYQMKKDIIQPFEDDISIISPEDDDDSLSSYQSTNSQQTLLSQQSTKSILNLPNNNIQKKLSKTKKKSNIFFNVYTSKHRTYSFLRT